MLQASEPRRLQLVYGVVKATHTVTDLGMTAIIDLCPHQGLAGWQSEDILSSNDLFAAYTTTILDFARAISQRGGGKVVLELMNEPPGGWGWSDTTNWLGRQVALVKAVRAIAPNLPLIVEGDRGGGIDGLLRIDPSAFDDPAIVYSFHYYTPTVVTHQGRPGEACPTGPTSPARPIPRCRAANQR